MRNEPWNQFKDFSATMKLMHNLFFEKMAIFILGNSPQGPAVIHAPTEQRERNSESVFSAMIIFSHTLGKI